MLLCDPHATHTNLNAGTVSAIDLNGASLIREKTADYKQVNPFIRVFREYDRERNHLLVLVTICIDAH